MTDQELKDIVAAVVAELEKSGVDFDYKIEAPLDTDTIFVIRGTAPNYQGVTVTWKGLLDIITAQATQAKNDAETAKNAANTILEQVQSKGTEITNFVATSKAEIETQKNESVNAVKSVYQTDLDELKGDLNKLGEVNVTLEDGFIATADGSIQPPTGDAQKHSDFIPVSYGSKIEATITLNSNHYKLASLYAYDINKGYIGRIAVVEGGVVSNYTISANITSTSIKYVRLSLNSYNDLVDISIKALSNVSEALKDVDEKIVNAVNPIVADIGIISNLDNVFYQYIDTSNWESGYYYNWNNGQTGVQKNASGTDWNANAIYNIPAGTYHYNKFCHLPFSFIENISTGQIQKVADAGFVETANGSITISYPFNLYLTLNTGFQDNAKTMLSNGYLPSSYSYGWYKNSAPYYTNAQGQTVYVVGEGYIPTIQGACDMASANDIIFIRCGVYTEQVSIWNKKLHLIGENKSNTILIDHSGNYNTPPLEMSLGSLSNMTIIEDGTEADASTDGSAYNMAYCLHIEWTPPANEVFKIDNCDFINYIHSPLGCGLYQDYTVHFKDCTFRCEASDEGSNERGSFYFHSNINPNVTGQKIIAENCIISSAGQKWTVLLGVPSGANNTGEAEARFSGCTIWNDNLGTVDSIAYFDTTGGADVLKVVNSYGNTVNILNN